MTRRHAKVLWMCLALGLCSGCLSRRLTRVPLEDWAVREFPSMGFSLDIPRESLLVDTTGVKKWERDGTGWRTLSFYLHYVATRQFLAEPLYLTNFSFERLNAEQYRGFTNGTHSLSYYWVWQKNHDHEYTSIVQFVTTNANGKVLGWRRNYPCRNGDVVVAGVEYIPAFVNGGQRQADIKAVGRVLNSFTELSGQKLAR